MKGVRPIYKKLLIAAIAVFVVGVGFALSELYYKVGVLEHAFMDMTYGRMHSHTKK